jgi:hypothetical protein
VEDEIEVEEPVEEEDEIMISPSELEEDDEEEPEDKIMHDVEPQVALDQQHKEINDTDMHYFDTKSASVLPLPSITTTTTTSSNNEKQPITKCRLPLPSFSVDKRVSAAIPVNEKIANVIRKRQSMSDTNRSQGSRIPMLCILQSLPEEETKPKLRTVKSVRLNTPSPLPQQIKSLSGSSANNENAASAASTVVRKPLTRSNTMPSIKSPPSSRRLNNKSPLSNIETKSSSQKRSSPRSPLTDLKTNTTRKSPQPPPTQKVKKELPPKSSIYRHKRLPAGESRTARLMMGISTNGRRQSFRSREEEPAVELSPTLGHRFGKLFHKTSTQTVNLAPPLLQHPTASATTTPQNKRRPMSFAASSSSLILTSNKYEKSNIPTTTATNKQQKRQSVPIPPPHQKVSSSREDNKKKPSSSGGKGNISSIKAPLRVH